MTVAYSVKICESFGFARSIDDAKQLFSSNELAEICILGEDGIDSIDDIYGPNIIIPLGEHTTTIIKIPHECDDSEAIASIGLTEDISPTMTIDNTILRMLHDHYGEFHDTARRKDILSILSSHNVPTLELEEEYPLEYDEQQLTIVANTRWFADVEIVVNKEETTRAGAHTASIRGATLSNSSQLEAFSKNKFTVIHGRKGASIQAISPLMNHDTLDSMARNGVVCSPSLAEELSLHRLMRKLTAIGQESCSSAAIGQESCGFTVIAVHPSYEMKGIRSNTVGEHTEPAYILQEGEILAVFYRYIVRNFFGYCTTYSETMKDHKYYI
jgi:hypothetical protein